MRFVRGNDISEIPLYLNPDFSPTTDPVPKSETSNGAGCGVPANTLLALDFSVLPS
jgi:hypothetical protein